MLFSKIIFTFLFIASIFNQIIAQPANIKFDQVGLEQGLSQSTVYAIVQDKQGFMWFGTQDGLNRYDGYNIKVFRHDPTDSNSISDNTIWSLLCDKKGNLWIGTERGGLNRYVASENRFYHYIHNEKDNTTIGDNYILSLFEDSRGNIWIGTYNKGLHLFNAKKKSFKRILFDKKNTESLSNRIWEICEDDKGNLWIGTENGLYKLNINKNTLTDNDFNFERHSYNPANLNSLSGNKIRHLHLDRKGILWISVWGSGINYYDQKTNSFKRYQNTVKFVLSIFEDSKKNIWIGSVDSGLVILSSEEDRFILNKRFSNISNLSSSPITSLYQDKSGILWIGTMTSGIYKYNWRENRFKHYYDDPNNLNDMSGNLAQAFLEDAEGELWVGTFDKGLNRFSKKREKVKHYNFDTTDPYSLSNNRVWALCETTDGSIWIGTYGGGLNRFDKSTGKFKRYFQGKSINARNKYITELYEDSKGNLWIGYTFGIDRYNRETNTFTAFLPDNNGNGGLTGSVVTSICENGEGQILISTLNGGGVHIYNPEIDTIIRLKLLPDTIYKQGISDSDVSVHSVYIDNNGIIWVGTLGNGLIKFNPAEKIKTYYKEKDGLPNNTVYGILPDKTGNLWLSTNYGLSLFNPKTHSFRNFNANDGLQSNEFNQGAYYRSPKGEMFFGGVNGFNSFFPENIIDNEYIPPIYITTFKVFNETLPLPNPIPADKIIELSYFQNFFSCEFVALNYTVPEKNQYAYMLEGFDKNWNYVPSSQRYASYTNLDPGEYILYIKASNNDGLWNEEGTSVTIKVNPPFWMAWWFRTAIAVLFCGAIVFTVRLIERRKTRGKILQVEKETAIEKERLRIARDMHDDVGARLTEIGMIGDLAKRKDANGLLSHKKIEKMTNIARETVTVFDEIVWTINPRYDRVDHVANYFGQYAVEYLSSSDIRCKLEIPDGLPEVAVASDVRHNLFMVFKEALNNIVKHSQATLATIHCNVENQMLQLTIKDNGIGIKRTKQSSNEKTYSEGLESMEQRIQKIQGKIKIESEPGTGAIVIISVPLKNKNHHF